MVIRPKKPRRPKRSRAARIAIGSLKVLLLLFVSSVLAVLALRWIPPLTSGVMIERRIEALFAGKSYSLDYRWVPWGRIAKHAGLAVMAAEDQNFPTHHGFDFESLQKAIDAHEKGKRLRGASTISQQVAKNVFLWSGRSFVRKGLEAYFTVLVELLWPKRRILEVYVNVAEMGAGVFGVEAASQRYLQETRREADAIRRRPAGRGAAESHPTEGGPPVGLRRRTPRVDSAADEPDGRDRAGGWAVAGLRAVLP